MRPIFLYTPSPESWHPERCHITELSNDPHDPALSIARARVPAGVTERYVMLEGRGRVEVGDLAPHEVGPGDIVLIPPGCRQRIAALGPADLVFLALCTPRFTPAAYEDLGDR